MGVAQVAVLLKAVADLFGSLLVVGTATSKAFLNGRQRLSIHRVMALCGQVLHPAGNLLGAAGHMVEKAFQVAGDQDVHGGRSRLVELPAGIVGAGADEVGEDVVFIGGADQPPHRQAHTLGVVACQNVAEVAGGNAEVHRFAPSYGALFRQAEIGVEVIDDLRHQSAPVDGVCTGQADAPLFQGRRHVGIGKDLLDAGLGIVKVAVHRIDMDVIALLGGHLQVLDLTGSGIGIEHRDLDAFQACITRQSRLAGIPRGCHQNPGSLGAVQVLLALKQQLGHQLQSVVLEGAGGTVPQLQRIQAVANFLHMARFACKGIAVGSRSGLGQEGRIIVGQERTDHLVRQLRIRKALPCLQVCLREGLGNIQAAVRRKTPDDCLGCRDAADSTACALIFHS